MHLDLSLTANVEGKDLEVRRRPLGSTIFDMTPLSSHSHGAQLSRMFADAALTVMEVEES